MSKETHTIPRPLVRLRLNQWTIVLSVVATWLTQLEIFLLIPLIAGLSGLFFKYNPIMRLGKKFLRKHPSQYIPEDFQQQQFNQVISVICLSLGLISYLLGWNLAAIIFTTVVALAAFIAILGFCIGCFIRFQWQQYNYRKTIN